MMMAMLIGMTKMIWGLWHWTRQGSEQISVSDPFCDTYGDDDDDDDVYGGVDDNVDDGDDDDDDDVNGEVDDDVDNGDDDVGADGA